MENVVLIRLNERAKELNCLYQVIELLNNPDNNMGFIFRKIVKIIPPAWQYPSVCHVRITFERETYLSDDFIEGIWSQKADIIVDDKQLGCIEVFYSQFIRDHQGSQFLPEEQKLLNTIALKVGDFIFTQKLYKSLLLLKDKEKSSGFTDSELLGQNQDFHWKWRYHMTEILVNKMDYQKLGVVKCYLIGSVKNAESGPGSDIDLLIHFNGDEVQQALLEQYIKGWSYSLAEYNYQKTGYESKDGLIDMHLITENDMINKSSYAVMIGSPYNSAKEITRNIEN